MRPAQVLVLLASCGTEPSIKSDAAVDSGTSVDAPLDAPAPPNGCTPALAVDLTATAANRTITIQDDFFTPQCAKILVGQTLTWSGNFDEHPLAPGIVRPTQVETQPGNPIPNVSSGSSQSVTFDTAADWGFYCPRHSGMMGLVYVVMP